MQGAGILAAKSASRVGAGYVFLATYIKDFPRYKFPDFLVEDNTGRIDFQKFSSVGFGPGLGTSKNSERLLKLLLRSAQEKVVLDADGLNLLSKMQIKKLPHGWILTPHEGEMARLLNVSSRKIKAQREWAIQKTYEKFQCHIILKGSPTLVFDGKNLFKIKSGNVALAKAGTGDVLTGMITGFLSQGVSPLNAALLSTFVHGAMADDWVKQNDSLSLMASDLVDRIPRTLKKLRK